MKLSNTYKVSVVSVLLMAVSVANAEENKSEGKSVDMPEVVILVDTGKDNEPIAKHESAEAFEKIHDYLTDVLDLSNGQADALLTIHNNSFMAAPQKRTVAGDLEKEAMVESLLNATMDKMVNSMTPEVREEYNQAVADDAEAEIPAKQSFLTYEYKVNYLTQQIGLDSDQADKLMQLQIAILVL